MNKFFVGTLMAANAAAATQDSCTALVMSGGGSNGAWEIGVLWGLVNYGTASDFQYDVVSGISAGSINTLALAGWEKGRETEAVQWASDLWKNLHTSDVWKKWPFELYNALFGKAGMVDNSPLLAFLQSMVSQFEGFQRRIVLMATEVNTGDITLFNNDNTAFSDLPRAAVASSSIPGIFPPFIWGDGRMFMDGGAIHNVNAISAIDECMKIVDDESKITIDVLVCNAKAEIETSGHEVNSIENYFRSKNIRKAFQGPNNFHQDMVAHPKINFRYLAYEAEGHAGGTTEINFDGDKTWSMQEQGRKDAQALINAGESTHFELFKNYYESKELQEEFQDFGEFLNYLQ